MRDTIQLEFRQLTGGDLMILPVFMVAVLAAATSTPPPGGPGGLAMDHAQVKSCMAQWRAMVPASPRDRTYRDFFRHCMGMKDLNGPVPDMPPPTMLSTVDPATLNAPSN